MDVAEYRKLNKPGWVIQAIAGNKGAYIGSFWDSGIYTKEISNALAFGDYSIALNLSLTITRTTTSTWSVIPIPDLPKKDAEEEIKQGLQDVIRNIDKDKVGSLTYRSIAEDLYDLVSRIVEEKLKNQ